MDTSVIPSYARIGVVGLIVCFAVYRLTQFFQRQKHPFPPSPPGDFLLGHYRKVPLDAAFKQYAKWGKEYGSDVLYLESFGTKWIVLNSLKSAIDLLENRGANYSDRPRFVLFEEMGWAPTLTWLRWGPKMQLHRKILQPAFTKAAVRRYQDHQKRQALICIRSVLSQPHSWDESVRQFAIAIVLHISYGINVESRDSRWIEISNNTAQAIGRSGAPASSIIDRFPATRYLPDWLPFMERLRYARKWRFAIEDMTNLPFAEAMRDMDNNLQERCFAHDRIRIHKLNEEEGLDNEFTLEDIKGASATINIAGADTTAITIRLLVLYLMQNPEVQMKAREEMDRVVGTDRLPDWEDMPQLPYLNLVLQETYRMCPLSSLGIPHASVADDVYNGMFIPKGTIVYQNIWAMSHDEDVYTNPSEFRPERYLPKNEGGNDEPFAVGNFGFGRRVCIGRNLAENSLHIILASIIAALDIRYPLDSQGERPAFEPEWSLRGLAHPLPFPVSFAARSPEVEKQLEAALLERSVSLD